MLRACKTNCDDCVTGENFPLILNTSWFRLSLVKEIMNMKKLNVTLAILVAAVMAGNAQTNTVTSEPVGYVNLKITGSGTGTSKKLTYLSVPLLDKQISISGKTTGTITAVTATTITDSAAGWTPGQLSAPATPYLIGITSGTATGRVFLIAASAATAGASGSAALANTATTVTISSIDSNSGISDLAAAGVAAGDSYSIYAADTLSSALGSPGTTGVLSGASSTVADSVVIIFNGVANTYFHNGTRWTRVFSGNPDASNTPILPFYGLVYSRLGAGDLNLTVTGTVPTLLRKAQIKNSGVTLFASYYPVDSTLAALGLQNLSGWTSNTLSALADKVVLVSSTGVANTYWYNGSGWKRVFAGSPAADSTVIPVGSMIYINKIGSAPGSSTYAQALPYTL